MAENSLDLPNANTRNILARLDLQIIDAEKAEKEIFEVINTLTARMQHFESAREEMIDLRRRLQPMLDPDAPSEIR